MACPTSLRPGLRPVSVRHDGDHSLVIARRHDVFLFAPGRATSSPRARAIESLEWAILTAIVMTFSPRATERHMLFTFLLYGLGAGLLFVEKAKTPARY